MRIRPASLPGALSTSSARSQCDGAAGVDDEAVDGDPGPLAEAQFGGAPEPEAGAGALARLDPVADENGAVGRESAPRLAELGHRVPPQIGHQPGGRRALRRGLRQGSQRQAAEAEQGGGAHESAAVQSPFTRPRRSILDPSHDARPFSPRYSCPCPMLHGQAEEHGTGRYPIGRRGRRLVHAALSCADRVSPLPSRPWRCPVGCAILGARPGRNAPVEKEVAP